MNITVIINFFRVQNYKFYCLGPGVGAAWSRPFLPGAAQVDVPGTVGDIYVSSV